MGAAVVGLNVDVVGDPLPSNGDTVGVDDGALLGTVGLVVCAVGACTTTCMIYIVEETFRSTLKVSRTYD